ncbi:MAG: GGDEF domain-containing protein [Solirubrobacteraceae bacterium]|nr:GGDEF domain-containing protein [Solirubrobacteraceae bacterium]
MFKRLAPALRGRVTRRAIVHSPYTWNATAAVFVIFSISDFVVTFTVGGMHTERLIPLATCIGAVGIALFATRPPEPGSPWTHAVVFAVYGGVSAAVFAHAPQGSAPMITGIYIPVLAALWITDRRLVAAHLTVASALLLAASLSGGNETATLVAALCFIPSCVMLGICCIAVLDAVDAQGDALDALALRDPLTGLGNRRAYDEELSAELARHRSSGRPLAIVDLSIRRFDDLIDHVGPAAGDAVLAAVARALVQVAPTGSTVARLEGDRFAVILPGTDRPSAEEYAAVVNETLPSHAGRHPIELLAGTAAYPSDGERRLALQSTATARRGEAEDAHAGPSTLRPDAVADPDDAPARPWAVVLGDLEPVAAPANMPRRVTRENLAVDPLVWRAVSAGFLVYAIVGVVAKQLVADLASSEIYYVAGVAALLGLVNLLTRPPRINTVRNHMVVSAGYLLPLAAMLSAAPKLSWVIGTALLAPLLTAVRVIDRRAILAHLLALTALALAVAIAGIPDEAGMVGIVALLANTWVLTVSMTVVFEAAERQSAEISGLVLRDPLTGTGNRDLIRQHALEIRPRHRDLQLPFSVIEVDAVGFDDILHGAGRGRANQVLRELARAITEVAGPRATVARVSGSTFRVLLPFTETEDLAPFEEELRIAVAGVSTDHHPLGARVGMAEFPRDGDDTAELERLAGSRRAADDPAAHDLRDALAVLAELHGPRR